MDARLPFAHATEHDATRVWVIAEIGVNHDGSLEQAEALIRSAHNVGCDAVKFQFFSAERLLSAESKLATYQESAASSADELLKPLELDLKAMQSLRKTARESGIGFGVTPFSLEDVADLEDLKPDFIKVASPDVVNLPLLDAVLELGMPTLVSTGASELHEVRDAAEQLQKHAAGGALLQCVSSYPVAMEDASLGGIDALREAFGLPVGYSDHTGEARTGGLAVAAGACVLEKHFTHDVEASGPDHAASLDASGMERYVREAREAAQALGPVSKHLSDVEADVRRVSRQSVCVLKDLPEGHRLERGDLTIKRPGLGIAPERLGELVGRTLVRTVKADHLLREQDLI